MATLTGAGHTGRLGAFAECSSKIGLHDNRSGRRRPETLAHGGRNALLPTNLYCIGIPGGAYGPVVLDVATSMLTGVWIYAAREAGLTLPVRPWRPGTISTAGRSYPKAGTWAMVLPRSWKSSAKPCRGRLPRAKSTGCCWRCIATVIVRRRPCGPQPKKSCRKFAPVHRRQALIGSKHPESGSATIGITAAADPGVLRILAPIWERIRALASSGKRQR